MTIIPARHELTINGKSSLWSAYVSAECSCGLWTSEGTSHDQLAEDYQVHRDVIDEAARFESQRLDNAVGRDMNLGSK